MASGSVAKLEEKPGCRFTTPLLWWVLAAVISGCTNAPCRQPSRSYPKNTQLGGRPASSGETSVQSDKEKGEKVSSTILVYKYDGSVQCSQDRPISLRQMEKDLEGIEVVSRDKKQDGLIHIQVCGAKTGKANVYEISSEDKEKAEKLGFRIWNF